MIADAGGRAGDAAAGEPSAWPEIDVDVRPGGLVPRWTASSEHPEVGPIRGRGISRAGAVRSLVRDLRRTRGRAPVAPHEANGVNTDECVPRVDASPPERPPRPSPPGSHSRETTT